MNILWLFVYNLYYFDNSTVQPTSSALKEQSRISLQAALTEIEELKQSQRCVEISLAKQIEENEQLTQKLNKQIEKSEVRSLINISHSDMG